MEESEKLPLKRVELSLTKFNEVAIPHHLDLLRQHKVNIVKYENAGEYSRVLSEQTHARRVAAQLRALLGEMDSLRRRVRDSDLVRFDALTQKSRDLTLRAVQDYLDMSPAKLGGARKPAPAPIIGSTTSSESVGVLPPELELENNLQLQVDTYELELRSREQVLRGWSELQTEVRALHDAWQHIQACALHQREHVATTVRSVDVAADNVQAARAHLSSAEKLRAGVMVAGGAVAGALAGGPVGLAVGMKAGAAAALAGSLLGAFGVRFLGRRALPAPETTTDEGEKNEGEKEKGGEKKKDE